MCRATETYPIRHRNLDDSMDSFFLRKKIVSLAAAASNDSSFAQSRNKVPPNRTSLPTPAAADTPKAKEPEQQRPPAADASRQPAPPSPESNITTWHHKMCRATEAHPIRHRNSDDSMDSFFLCKKIAATASNDSSSAQSRNEVPPNLTSPPNAGAADTPKAKEPERATSSCCRRVTPAHAPVARVKKDNFCPQQRRQQRHDVRNKKKIHNIKSVRFSSVHIREYAPVVGDNPSCNEGLPVQLGWEHTPTSSFEGGIDAYEKSREGSRMTCNGNLAAVELRMSRRRRMEVLIEAGGIRPMELVRRERRILMRERDEFFGQI
eukprot:CAMPEP_0197464460 /NCGR_PEP_ID=MMETSP1175-20131217/64034_1 /TAXON_ID=1003142 /ORGANISM="Triceratium dubium, Strain CCMP147" /LENGTH=320 /DNA_ID=CAMNT_0043000441 /DNA_START=287 /DNA_END=1251 /DNA_ORIENTATION=+